MNIDIKELGKKASGLTTLIYLIDALRTGATYGERIILEKFGFMPSTGEDNDKIGSHFNDNSDTSIVKFHSGGSAPTWSIINVNDEVTLFEGYDFQNKKYDKTAMDEYFVRFENELIQFGLKIVKS